MAVADIQYSEAIGYTYQHVYIALVLNMESWNDMKRHNFNPAIYKGFEHPTFEGRTEPYSLRKENARLKKEIENLKEEISVLKKRV